MKLFSASDIFEINKKSIAKENISSFELMERAASAVASEIMSRWLPTQRIIVFAGPGDNGGHALATARLLIDQGYRPEILLLNTKNHLSPDCQKNKDKLGEYEYPFFQEVIQSLELPGISQSDVVIDGLFGRDLTEMLRHGYQVLVRAINESGAFVVSIDVPSGLFSEFNKSNIRRNIVHADLTLAFQFPCFSFFFTENAECVGEWQVIDLGLDREAIRSTPSSYFLIDETGVKEALLPRNPFSSKDDYGRIYLAAGSLGMMGAAILCSRAAMRAGAGVVVTHAPKCGYIIMQTSVPEALFDSDPDECHISEIAPHPKYTVTAIGPGIGTDKKTIDALETFLKQATKPVILDADALNCIAQRGTMLGDIPRNSIITPHIKEFDRLFGDFYSDEERFSKALEMARFLKIVIVLKGHYTMVIRPDGKVFVNNTGNPGMATAGSGDVLTGIISALAAQGYRPDIAASVGTFLHGYAGNLAADRHGEIGMTASDIVDNIGIAIKRIMERH